MYALIIQSVPTRYRTLHLFNNITTNENNGTRRIRWAGHVTRMEEGRGVHKVLVGKPEGKRPLGRPRRRWENNIKMDLIVVVLLYCYCFLYVFGWYCVYVSFYSVFAAFTMYFVPMRFLLMLYVSIIFLNIYGWYCVYVSFQSVLPVGTVCIIFLYVSG
jgi:hypothetical protein